MVGRRANIPPKHAARLSNLGPHHVITASCGSCRHRRTMRLWEATAGISPTTWLTSIEARLRCRRCDSRGDATLLVMVSEED